MADKLRRAKVPRHIRIYHRQMQSEVWKHLTGTSVKVLLALAGLEKGDNNGEFFLSVRKAAELTGLSKNAVNRALHELMDKGFIYCAQRGGFSRKTPHAACWGLTWQAGPKGSEHRAPSHAYEKWRPEKKGGPRNADSAVPEKGAVSQNLPRQCLQIRDRDLAEMAETRQVAAVRKSGTHNSNQVQHSEHTVESGGAMPALAWWNPHTAPSLSKLIYASALTALLENASIERRAA